MGIQNTSVLKNQKAEYLPRGKTTLHQVFERHFTDFRSRYDEEYFDTFGKFRLEKVQAVGEHFLTCGDYRQGIARIRCSNPYCGHDYFRPFSCKGFYLCPRLHGRAAIRRIAASPILLEGGFDAKGPLSIFPFLVSRK